MHSPEKNEELLAEGLRELFYDKDRTKPNEYHITELLMCPTKSFIARKYHTRPSINGKIFTGLMFHTFIPNLIKSVSFLKEGKAEVPVSKKYDGYKIVGQADIVTPTQIYEFKFTGTDVQKYGMHDHWKNQANAYANMFGKKTYFLITINRDTLKVKINSFYAEKLVFQALEHKAEVLHKAITDDVMPIGPTFQWECKYCDVKDYCIVHQNNMEGTDYVSRNKV